MNFEIIKTVIKNRRSYKPMLMNGKKIDDDIINNLLELADWAPTHAHTEPWRFVVFANEAVQQFCNDHAALYKANAPAEKFETAKYEKIRHNGDHCSHIIAVYMKRGANPKITVIEEICAVAAAVQNLLLGAASLNIAALWSTGGLTFHSAMKNYLGLREEDQMIGLIYLGYADKAIKEGSRIIPLNEKVDRRG
ncbi:nitroreductase [Parafilimonas sp.]|uniref:nitroreductase family protein n=1 Tax=Parafilimonas sp. TaxID=1969739 RepID=UPI0039E63374